MSGADLFPSAARLAWEREQEASPFSAAEVREEIARVAKPGATVVAWVAPAPRRYAILGPSGTRCGIYPGPRPLDAMALDAGFAGVEEWSAATGVAPERMRLAPVPERGELCILPGGLLGRCSVPSDGPGLVRVERWRPDGGWVDFGSARECRLTTEGVEGHHHYSAARAAAAAQETDR